MSTSLSELFRVFGRIGLLSFGGPAAQIALMHKELVEKKRWLNEDDFLSALSFCMLLPGPEAMQLATFAGWKKAGVSGGLLAGLLFVLPGAAVIAALATIYVLYGSVPVVAAVFMGVQATVVAIVLEALFKVSKRALKSRIHWGIAALSFVAIFAFHLPFPLIIALAALIGTNFLKGDVSPNKPPIEDTKLQNLASTIAIWGAIWTAPIAVLWAVDASLLLEIALFFSKLAVVTFGGAYAVLAYMTQTLVSDFGWITTQQMMDGLGLAETTPGPLILVTQFVGFLAGFRESGLGLAFAAALVTLWVTFAPCFLWIFAAAPYVSRLSNMPRLKGALAGVTAAVVGVILNLSIWFGAHVMFKTIGMTKIGPVQIIWPEFASVNHIALGISGLAALMLLRFHIGLGRTLAMGAFAGILASAFT